MEPEDNVPHLGIDTSDCDDCTDSPFLLLEEGACLLLEEGSGIRLEN